MQDFQLAWLMPARTTLLCALVAAAASTASQAVFMPATTVKGSTSQHAFLRAAGCHVGVGAVCVLVMLAVVYHAERETIRSMCSLQGQGRTTNAAAAATAHSEDQPGTDEQSKKLN